MIRFRNLKVLLLAGSLLAGGACQKDSAPVATSIVKANQAYLTAFGQPPVVVKGECFARVGYYPLRANPAQLRAVPFFLFDIETELPLLFERLVNNPLPFPADGPLLNPYPPGSTVRVDLHPGMLELDLKLKQNPDPAQLAPMAAALTETAGQYPDISRVRLLLNGTPWPGMPKDGVRPDPSRIVDPGPPQLLLVVGSWEAGSDGPAEILADFDRPVTVDSFILRDEAGNSLKGELFTSAFDMAVVLHPEHPETLSEGMSLRGMWKVTDRLGRSGEGEGRFELQRHDHPQSP